MAQLQLRLFWLMALRRIAFDYITVTGCTGHRVFGVFVTVTADLGGMGKQMDMLVRQIATKFSFKRGERY